MATDLYSRIMENGTAGWYWEIVTKTRDVLARGLADTHAAARAETAQAAWKAKQDQTPLGDPFSESLESFNHLDQIGHFPKPNQQT
jgi:hypothetical protein